ncbi:MAG: histidine phosphatase family protein [Dysgonamonadaceae bacterium]|nr:histidine phosphatase family protein [Dysgonamonadaceae bacterium]
MSELKINKIFTSPVQRCVQTAEYIAKGYGKPLEITQSRELGDPGLIETSKWTLQAH